jgi:hypothetical protein
VNCALSGNPLGCSFNPLIFDGAFVPDTGGTPFIIGSFRLPLLSPAAGWGLAMALTALGLALLSRHTRRR